MKSKFIGLVFGAWFILPAIALAEPIKPFGGFQWGMTPEEFREKLCATDKPFGSIDDRKQICDGDPWFPAAPLSNVDKTDAIDRSVAIERLEQDISYTNHLVLNEVTGYSRRLQVQLSPVEIFGADFTVYAVFVEVPGVVAKNHISHMENGAIPGTNCWTPRDFSFSDEFSLAGEFCEYPPSLVTVELRSLDERGMENYEKISEQLKSRYYNSAMDERYLDQQELFNYAQIDGTGIELTYYPDGVEVGVAEVAITYTADEFIERKFSEAEEDLIDKKSTIGENDMGDSL